MHLSQLVKVSLTPPMVVITPAGEDVPVPVAAAAEVPVPVGNDIPLGMAVGNPEGMDIPDGIAVGKPAGTSVGRAGVCLGNKSRSRFTLMLAARPPLFLCDFQKRWVGIG
jgi:hypothetical protein